MSDSFREESHLIGLVILVGRLAQELVASGLEPYGITYAQAAALVRLWRSPGGFRRQSELIESLAVSRAAGSEVLQELEEKRLIVRRVDSSDNRMQIVALTEAGHSLEQPVLEVFRRAEADVVQVADEAQSTLFEALRNMLERSRERRRSGRKKAS